MEQISFFLDARLLWKGGCSLNKDRAEHMWELKQTNEADQTSLNAHPYAKKMPYEAQKYIEFCWTGQNEERDSIEGKEQQ